MFLGQHYLKRAIAFSKHKILTLRGFCFSIILEHLESHDLESNEVLTGLFPLPFLAGEHFPQTHVGSVSHVLSRPSSLPQRGQVGVPEESHQIGEKHPELQRDVVDVNKLHRGPDSPVHLQRRPESSSHLGSEGGRVPPLQEVHDEEEHQQEGRCKEEAVQEEPLDPGQGDLGRDPVLQEEVEVVTQWPCEEEPALLVFFQSVERSGEN